MIECQIDNEMRLQMTRIERLLGRSIIVADRTETGIYKFYLRADKDYRDQRPKYLVENLTYGEMMDFLKRLKEFLTPVWRE